MIAIPIFIALIYLLYRILSPSQEVKELLRAKHPAAAEPPSTDTSHSI